MTSQPKFRSGLALAMVAAGCALALCACAGNGGGAGPAAAQAAWVGGDPAKLKGDEAGCRQESAAVDPNVIGGYSDPRYGMTSAMAAAVARENPLSNNSRQAHAAAFAACMGDKGWREP